MLGCDRSGEWLQRELQKYRETWWPKEALGSQGARVFLTHIAFDFN